MSDPQFPQQYSTPSPAWPPPAASPVSHSGIGITSFILSILGGATLMFAFLKAGYDVKTMGLEEYKQSSDAVIVGLLIMGGMAGEGIAFVLGIVSLFFKNRKKLFGILGVCFSVIPAILTMLLLFIGLLKRH